MVYSSLEPTIQIFAKSAPIQISLSNKTDTSPINRYFSPRPFNWEKVNYHYSKMDLDNFYMSVALQEAQKAYEENEVPVGAVVVLHNRVIGKGYNQTVRLNDPTAHAEMIALTSASNFLKSRYLKECTMYVTLEPCVMCAGASFWAQLGGIVYGASDLKRGFSRHEPILLHPQTFLKSGVMEKECTDLLNKFFKTLRKK